MTQPLSPPAAPIYRLNLPDMHYPTLNTRRSKLYDGGHIRAWREAAAWAAKAAKVPRLDRPTVRLHFWPGDNRRRDRINLALVHKAVVDGLVDAGVLLDDSPDELDELMPAIHRGREHPRRWVLVIEPRPDEVF